MREIEKKIIFYYLLLLLCGFLCTGCNRQEKTELQEMTIEETKEDTDEDIKEDTQEKQEIDHPTWIYVCGAVEHPGVYSFQGEVRLFEVIEKAGGFTKNAAIEYLNQVQVLEDGEQIRVPTKQEVKDGQSLAIVDDSSQIKEQLDGTTDKININTATKEELMTLSGIGEAKASSIISYREANGKFQKIEDVMQIEGIKDGVFQKIKEEITV